MAGKYCVFDVAENGDKVLVGSFETQQEAEAALDPAKVQSMEKVTDLGTTVLFSRDPRAES